MTQQEQIELDTWDLGRLADRLLSEADDIDAASLRTVENARDILNEIIARQDVRVA